MTATLHTRTTTPIPCHLPGPLLIAYRDSDVFVAVPLDDDGRTAIHTASAGEARALAEQFIAAAMVHDEHQRALSAVRARLAPVPDLSPYTGSEAYCLVCDIKVADDGSHTTPSGLHVSPEDTRHHLGLRSVVRKAATP